MRFVHSRLIPDNAILQIMPLEMREASSVLDWRCIYRLYRSAFPRSERKPFSIIVSMRRRGKTDVWCFRKEGRFAGFAATINDRQLILLDYLAVPEKMRGKGVGSRILEALKQKYAGKGVFVEIESTYEAAADMDQRRRRKHFYEAAGMRPLGVLAGVFGVNMELLGWNCSLDFRSYHSFYRDNYSSFAAQNIVECTLPEERKADMKREDQDAAADCAQ